MQIFNKNISSPLSQFEIRDLLFIDIPMLDNLHISLTNIGFFLTVTTIFITVLTISTTNFNKLVSNE